MDDGRLEASIPRHYGPIAWKRIAVDWWRGLQMKRTLKRMTPEQRAEALAFFKDISQ